MGKRYRKMERKVNGRIREISNGRIVLELPLPVAEVLSGIPEAVERMSREAGLMVVSALLEDECERIAGPKNSRNPLRTANWWGGDLRPVYFDKQKVVIERPRLRGKDNREIPLSTYEAFRDPKGMRRHVMKNLVLGISSRNYEEAVESVVKGYGIKKSSVSRHFVEATAEQMREFMERDLSGLDLCAIFMDGIEFKGHLLVVALGLDIRGKKHVLGLWQGATENAEVCKSLLEDMVRRGLDASKDYLFVLDGSKALRSAVARMFGSDAPVQRCQVHKRRNVKEHLPKEHQRAIDARISAAYKMTDYDKAKASLELTVKYLERLNPSAAASLREGLEETLTVHKLGITGLLRKTLSTTNPIESCFSVTRTITGRVKRWRGGDMVQRWAVAALLRAERKFRRVQGYREIPKLVAVLQQKNLDRKEAAA
ncbi:MAG: IS256 family transposase [Thermodesulfovibrionales bacterium]|nr:IS256 family transposase [Thermodesulfovibrionales bacterium]